MIYILKRLIFYSLFNSILVFNSMILISSNRYIRNDLDAFAEIKVESKSVPEGEDNVSEGTSCFVFTVMEIQELQIWDTIEPKVIASARW